MTFGRFLSFCNDNVLVCVILNDHCSNFDIVKKTVAEWLDFSLNGVILLSEVEKFFISTDNVLVVLDFSRGE